MSLDTSQRYEGSFQKKSLQKALNWQQERIKRDELMAARENTVRKEKETNLKSNWNESLQVAAENQRVKNEIKQTKGELKMAGKALIAVRRAQLRQLLQKEYALYEDELGQRGLAFYINRL
ncbi:uncharacterized protein LOC141906156 [Tubulanus polymorphus]|uniref:uncharacterized protein LOC141906156 n=1 Tax=Tubulanus polymorphus TaxID=672921 RepID=UPI003DA65B0B